MSILPLVIIVGTLIVISCTAMTLGKIAYNYGKQKGEGKK